MKNNSNRGIVLLKFDLKIYCNFIAKVPEANLLVRFLREMSGN